MFVTGTQRNSIFVNLHTFLRYTGQFNSVQNSCRSRMVKNVEFNVVYRTVNLVFNHYCSEVSLLWCCVLFSNVFVTDILM